MTISFVLLATIAISATGATDISYHQTNATYATKHTQTNYLNLGAAATADAVAEFSSEIGLRLRRKIDVLFVAVVCCCC